MAFFLRYFFLPFAGFLGFFASLWLYSQELISWSAADPTALLVLLIAVGSFGFFLVVALLLARNIDILRTAVAAVSALSLGVFAGLVAPGVAGAVPVWSAKPESVVYQLNFETVVIERDVIDAVASPLDGERGVLNYVAPLTEGGFVMVSSAGTEVFDLPDPATAAGSNAVLSVWSRDLHLLGHLSLSELEPMIQLVRGIYFDAESSVLYFSVQPFDQACHGLQLWSAEIDVERVSADTPILIFQTTPCVESASGPERFGGRVTMGADGTLYLSTGDFGFGVSTIREEQQDGDYQKRPIELEAPGSLGAVVAIESSGESFVMSRGHRNPQGLHFDPESGVLWESEHGPKGGDEINIIQEGLDYGWPDVTYGGPYGGVAQPDPTWAVGRWYGMNHSGYEPPVMTWLPAIAASQLLVYRGDEFPAWQGDVLLGAFRGDIHRVRIESSRAIFDEVIPIGVRPRDIIELVDGALLITTDDNEMLVVTQER